MLNQKKKALPKNRPTPKKAAPPKRVPSTPKPPIAEVKTPQAAPKPEVPKKEVPKQVIPPTAPTPPPVASTPQLEQFTYNQLKELSHQERAKHFEQLNKGRTTEFIQLIRRDHLPKQLVLRLLEAKTRDQVGSKPPGKDVHYCPYCVSYMKFQYHSYTGYHKCIGCSISTRDFYVSADNQLFNAN